MGIVRILFIVGAVFLQSQSSFAFDDKKVLEYIQFITKWSSLEYNNQPLPKIRTERAAMIQIYAYGDFAVAQAEYKKQPLRPVVALYFHETKELLVSEDLNLDVEAESGPTIVHELVHYLQDINGKTAQYDTKNKLVCLEGEAYDIQALWQVLNKVRPEQYHALQADILLSFMQCENQFKSQK